MTSSEDRERIVEDMLDNRDNFPRSEAERQVARSITSTPYCWECHDFHFATEEHSLPWNDLKPGSADWVDAWLHSGK